MKRKCADCNFVAKHSLMTIASSATGNDASLYIMMHAHKFAS